MICSFVRFLMYEALNKCLAMSPLRRRLRTARLACSTFGVYQERKLYRARQKVHAKIKDNAINKIYNITNNAVGSSLILPQAYYSVCRFVLLGHFVVFIEIQHTEAKTLRERSYFSNTASTAEGQAK